MLYEDSSTTIVHFQSHSCFKMSSRLLERGEVGIEQVKCGPWSYLPSVVTLKIVELRHEEMHPQPRCPLTSICQFARYDICRLMTAWHIPVMHHHHGSMGTAILCITSTVLRRWLLYARLLALLQNQCSSTAIVRAYTFR